MLTAGAQVFFTDDTLDSDVAALLAPHPATLLSHLRTDDRRVLELVGAAARLADVAASTAVTGRNCLRQLMIRQSSRRFRAAAATTTRWLPAPMRLRGVRRRSAGAWRRSTGVRCRPESSMRPRTPSTGVSSRRVRALSR
ncbi:hypothetical protein BZL30_3587 [Mycobacterium kansasii]|uniref:Uncharacterized protein n=1 Tax=Mycobacterium kansasii TaxID=1768 RepID=A0A1V3XBN1_MYCKA|nr:hypothetical protein BZL30_3587 [Mycobacterium kansasii]